MVYWIRRGAIVLVVLTLIIGLWWLVGSLRGGSPTSEGSNTDPAASSSASSEGDSPDSSSSPQPSASDIDVEIVDCPDSVIKVEATTDASTYPVGATPKLTLTITNTGSVACKRDVGPKANELEITSGGYHVWSSDDCNASNKSKVVTMQPDEPFGSSITWDGHLSQKGCPDGEGAAAKAGRYDLEGRNGEVTSDSTPFALTSKS